MDTSPHESNFVNVNGIRLHYLNWGGEGETLIFLTGMGCSAHFFDRIAPRFADSFRVLALTRRGQGESDFPQTGYDIDTLTDDILAFMDSMNVEKAILAGHSMAGIELSHLAVNHPQRVLKLIYLDSAYDLRGNQELWAKNPIKDVEPPDMKDEFISIEEYSRYIKHIYPEFAKIRADVWDEAIKHNLVQNEKGMFVDKDTGEIAKAMTDAMNSYAPEFTSIRAPVLSFYAIPTAFEPPNYLTEEQKNLWLEFMQNVFLPSRKRGMEKFSADVPHAKIIEIPGGHHYCFIVQEDLVYNEMRNFLLE